MRPLSIPTTNRRFNEIRRDTISQAFDFIGVCKIILDRP